MSDTRLTICLRIYMCLYYISHDWRYVRCLSSTCKWCKVVEFDCAMHQSWCMCTPDFYQHYRMYLISHKVAYIKITTSLHLHSSVFMTSHHIPYIKSFTMLSFLGIIVSEIKVYQVVRSPCITRLLGARLLIYCCSCCLAAQEFCHCQEYYSWLYPILSSVSSEKRIKE